MASLFVALDLPAAMTSALAALQPPDSRWVRCAKPGQMHVTLHYIGAGEIERFSGALARVRAPAFSLSVQGVGQFRSADGAITLWAALRECEELRNLHADIGTALSKEGFRPEARVYTPHITLARCDAALAGGEVEAFLCRYSTLSLPPVSIASFSLYASEHVGGIPIYRRERTFPLVAVSPSSP
jgi:2'-5' RNA ligase